MRLQVDSPMLAKGSNPAMDASKIPLDKNIKKHKKVLTTQQNRVTIYIQGEGSKPNRRGSSKQNG